MADNDNHIGFSPDGLLIKCEHYLDDKTIGHIDREGMGEDVVNEWKEGRSRTVLNVTHVLHFLPAIS